MSLPLAARLALVGTAALALGVPAYAYLATRDLERSWRQFQHGQELTWPPPSKPGGGPDLDGPLAAVAAAGRLGVAVVVGLALLVLCARGWQRYRRARQTVTWELRLGRDDTANPYRVQEAFEGILGAIAARWYQRLWAGQDHLALETHRLPDRSIRFTVCAPRRLRAAIAGPLEDLYPDVRLVEVSGRPRWTRHVVRLKKRRPFVLSVQTTKDYEHAFSESLVALLGSLDRELTVQLLLTPAADFVYHRARRQLKRRERGLNQRDRRDPIDPGMDSVVEAKELKGALELQHRSLCYFDLRVAGDDLNAVQRVAGLFSQLRSENELVRRHMRVRRRLYAGRLVAALTNLLPGLHTGVLSTSELATLWQLPRARAKHARLLRAAVRRVPAPPEICRDPALQLLEDEHGPVGLYPEDRKYGQAFMGGQNSGKSSQMARGIAADAADPSRAMFLADAKDDLAKLALGLIPPERTVHYIDLARPEAGFNPLAIDARPGARASVFLKALIEANPEGAIQARSDALLRQGVDAVCAAEQRPTTWHIYRMLSPAGGAYRERVLARLAGQPGTDFALYYWRREFPELLGDKGRANEVLEAPLNKIRRLISTPEVDVVLRHPYSIDIEGAIRRGEVVIVNGAKASIGEDNTSLLLQLLLQLVRRAVQAQQALPEPERRRVSLYVDEAHNVLTPSTATLLAEGRSAGLEACFAWQFSAQVRDELVRSGVRSLLQSISIFRMREMEDARSLAGLAMDVYSDRISVDREDQERLRFSADDILRLPVHTAINLWNARGTPRPGFIARTLPMQDLYNQELAAHHLAAQRARGGHHLAYLPAPLDTIDPGAPEPPRGAVQAAAETPQSSAGATLERRKEDAPRRPRLRPIGQANAALGADDGATPAEPPDELEDLL
jgi:hypothetical protein